MSRRSRDPRPPRFARWLLSVLAPPGRKSEVLGDLDRFFSRESRSTGTRAARARYVREVLEIGRWRVSRRSASDSAGRAARPTMRTDAFASMRAVLDGLRLDVRYGARSLRQQPGFTVVAVLTLALGIGSSTAMFSLLNAVLLRPLRLPDPEQVVMIAETLPSGEPTFVSGPGFEDYRRLATQAGAVAPGEAPLADVAAFQFWLPTMVTESGGRRVAGARVSPWLFRLLRIEPDLGRDFAVETQAGVDSRVVIISNGLWSEVFGRDPRIVGQTIELSGADYLVIGVLPASVDLPRDSEVWTPLSLDAAPWMLDRGVHPFLVYGRLADGAGFERASARLREIASRLQAEHPATNENVGVLVQPLLATVVGDAGQRLSLLLGAVVMVLLIACSNVANLGLARSASRRRELATYVALGASRGRLMRRLVAESSMLALGGGILGIAAARAGVGALPSLVPASTPRLGELAIDGNVVLFALLASSASVLVSAVGFSSRSLRSRRSAVDREDAAMLRRSFRNPGFAPALLIAELALSMLLLVGAGLFLRSLGALNDTDLGFDPENIATFRVALSDEEGAQRATDRILDGLSELPGTVAAAASHLPLAGQYMNVELSIFGGSRVGAGRPQASYRIVSPDYFAVLGVPLLRGRLLGPFDREGARRVAVVNNTAARRFWPAGEPVGGRVALHDSLEREGDAAWIEVVGVVDDVRHHGPAADPVPEVYVSHWQAGEGWNWTAGSIAFLLRGPPGALPDETTLREIVRRVDPGIPVDDVATLETFLRHSTSETRFAARLLEVFALLAVVLAAVGVYGVVSFAVLQRTPEIGVRMALGAHGPRLLLGVLGSGLRYSAIGMTLGAVIAAGVSRLVTHLLHGIQTLDAMSYTSAGGVLTSLTLLACYVPARRAASVDPATAIRRQ